MMKHPDGRVLDLDAIEALCIEANRPAEPLKCPNCQGHLHAVVQPLNSYLNRDQFEASRAGDFYCEKCSESVGTAEKSKTGYAYFWKNDVVKERPSERDQAEAFRREVPLLLAEIRMLQDRHESDEMLFRAMKDEAQAAIDAADERARMSWLLYDDTLDPNEFPPPHKCQIHLGGGFLHDRCMTCGRDMVGR